MIRVVVTADDFGSACEVNEAVELAHRRGVLTAASLMIGGPAVDDAVARARRLPSLGVGLHVVLVDGRPILPARDVPDLVDARGRFRSGLLSTSLRIALLPRVRRQLRAEVEAQFAAFAATGLRFDHVNAHKHFHVHPLVGAIVIEAARRHGVAALRVPVSDAGVDGAGWIARPFARRLARRARRSGLTTPDRVYGLDGTGRFDTRRLVDAMEVAATGLNEIYLHPATSDHYIGSTEGFRHRAELDGLLSDTVRVTVARRRVRLGSFAGCETMHAAVDDA